ncbi:MAG: hypothetical protein JWO42_2172, partial [Chloroflexi bacterium]|nr:hypothetical protein [Chloroflexota bacterium]
MAADYIMDGLADNALQVVRALLPGCSVAAGIVTASNRAMRVIGAIGPLRATLLEGHCLVAAYRAMSEHIAITTPIEEGKASGRKLVSVPIKGRDKVTLGAMQLLYDTPDLAPNVHAALESLTDQIAELIRHRRLNLDLQHSLNQLFLVYEVGRLFNLVSSLDDVLQQVRNQLAGTLNFHHCCIMLVTERQALVPEAGIGIDKQWMQEARPLVQRSVAARVLESGVAEQVTDPIELAGL